MRGAGQAVRLAASKWSADVKAEGQIEKPTFYGVFCLETCTQWWFFVSADVKASVFRGVLKFFEAP